IAAAEMRVLLTEFKEGVNAYLQGRGAKISTLEELILFNRTHADEEMPHFAQELFELAQRAGTTRDPAYLRALQAGYAQAREVIDDTMASLQLDALVAPSNSAGWHVSPEGDN